MSQNPHFLQYEKLLECPQGLVYSQTHVRSHDEEESRVKDYSETHVRSHDEEGSGVNKDYSQTHVRSHDEDRVRIVRT